MNSLDITFVTGNLNKVTNLERQLGFKLKHRKIDLDEIQSLDLHEIVEHKARQAYQKIGSTVLVEDGSLVFNELKNLPGPFIKWFEADPTVFQAILNNLKDRGATAQLVYGLYDGSGDVHFFAGEMRGMLAKKPRGKGGFGWDNIFMNEGCNVTRSEMSSQDYDLTSYRKPAIALLKNHLNNL